MGRGLLPIVQERDFTSYPIFAPSRFVATASKFQRLHDIVKVLYYNFKKSLKLTCQKRLWSIHWMSTFSLTFIGTGSAFTVYTDNFHSNMLLRHEDSGESLLIDCGSDARHALAALGVSHRDIGSVYVSHLHADHAGGMEWLALTRRFDETCDRPVFYAHPEILKSIWAETLRGGLSTLAGVRAELKSFFKPMPADASGVFYWENVRFLTVQTLHTLNNDCLMPTFGLFFTLGKTTILITTDTRFCTDVLGDYYRRADIIFHDCETQARPSGVHSHYNELLTLPAEIRAKMWLYHYNGSDLPNAKAAGFAGFVKRGQTFRFES